MSGRWWVCELGHRNNIDPKHDTNYWDRCATCITYRKPIETGYYIEPLQPAEVVR